MAPRLAAAWAVVLLGCCGTQAERPDGGVDCGGVSECGARSCADFARSCISDVMRCFRPEGSCILDDSAPSSGLFRRGRARSQVGCWPGGDRLYSDGDAFTRQGRLVPAALPACLECGWAAGAGGDRLVCRDPEREVLRIAPGWAAPGPAVVTCRGGRTETYCEADKALLFECFFLWGWERRCRPGRCPDVSVPAWPPRDGGRP